MAQATTKLKQQPALYIRRVFAAPLEAVYSAWTDAAQLARWFAPDPQCSTEVLEFDPQVNGRYRIKMIEANGENIAGGEFLELQPNRLLRISWAWEVKEGEEALDYSQSMVTVELKSVTNGTELHLTHERLPNAEIRQLHEQGWVGCLQQLEVLLRT